MLLAKASFLLLLNEMAVDLGFFLGRGEGKGAGSGVGMWLIVLQS